jgi:pyruvate dehydrogenase (quinone)
VIFEAYVDPDVPTLPPHIMFEQAKKYTTALIKGDPDEGGVIKQSVKDMFEGMLPHKGD